MEDSLLKGFAGIDDLKRRISGNKRYKDFAMLDKSVVFKDFFAGKDYLVQIHDATPVGNDNIIGFAGVFYWVGGKITPGDDDSYCDNFDVYGYKEFDVENSDKKGLDVLATGW